WDEYEACVSSSLLFFFSGVRLKTPAHLYPFCYLAVGHQWDTERCNSMLFLQHQFLTEIRTWVARSPAPHYPPNHLRPGSLAPNFGDHGPSDSALAASSGWRLHRPAADRSAARCASRDLCSGGAPRRYPPSKDKEWKQKREVIANLPFQLTFVRFHWK